MYWEHQELDQEEAAACKALLEEAANFIFTTLLLVHSLLLDVQTLLQFWSRLLARNQLSFEKACTRWMLAWALALVPA